MKAWLAGMFRRFANGLDRSAPRPHPPAPETRALTYRQAAPLVPDIDVDDDAMESAAFWRMVRAMRNLCSDHPHRLTPEEHNQILLEALQESNRNQRRANRQFFEAMTSPSLRLAARARRLTD